MSTVADDERRAGRADAAARRLRIRGHATSEYTFGAALLTATQAGPAAAERVVRDRGSVDRRLEYLLGELLRQAAGVPRGTVELGPFRAGTRVLGGPLHPGTLDRAVRYLVDRRPARLLTPDGKSATLMLTSRGVDSTGAPPPREWPSPRTPSVRKRRPRCPSGGYGSR